MAPRPKVSKLPPVPLIIQVQEEVPNAERSHLETVIIRHQPIAKQNNVIEQVEKQRETRSTSYAELTVQYGFTGENGLESQPNLSIDSG